MRIVVRVGLVVLASIQLSTGIWMERRLVLVALVAYLVYSVPHLVFHLGHLHDAASLDVAFIVLTLGGSVLLPLAVLVLGLRMPAADPPE